MQLQAQKIGTQSIDGTLARTMLDQSPACIKLLSGDGRLCFMSDNGMKAMEIDDFARVEGAFWWDLWPDDLRDALRDAVSAAGRGVSVCFEAPCPTATGKPRHWRVRLNQITGGHLDKMVLATSDDISDEVAVSAAREHLAAENAAMRRFTHFVAHDLRGPLRHQKMMAQMLRSGEDLDGAPEDIAEQIEDVATSMLDLLAGLEELHRLDRDGPEQQAQFPLRDLIEEAHTLTGRDRLAVDVTGDGADIALHANRGQILAVFSNLFDNAAKFHDQPGHCAVRVTCELPGADMLRVVVADDGPGFANDRLDDIFEPLVRQSNGANIRGDGLGLTIARRVALNHGGMLRSLAQTPDQRGAALELQLSVSGKQH